MTEKRKKIAVLSGAGISADSGLATFRDGNGLWDRYRIEDVCTPEALRTNREVVIGFYNLRRKELLGKEPNPGHYALASLERHFDVEIVTQNIDDLHERAGSTRVLHLHGELRKLRSTDPEERIYPIEGWRQDPEGRCEKGALLRPHVVFFGESVPNFEPAAEIVRSADLLVVTGTSLNVYPAASLVGYAKAEVPIYIVDPVIPPIAGLSNPLHPRAERAAAGLPKLAGLLVEKYAYEKI